jgi:MFS family permease
LLKIPKVKNKRQLSEDRKVDHFIVAYLKEFIEGLKAIIFIPGIIILFVMIFVLEYFGSMFWSVQIYLIQVIHSGTGIVASLFTTFSFLGIFIGSNIFVIRKYWNPVILFFFISILLVFLGDLVVILAPYQSFGLIFFTQIVKGFSLVFVYSMILTFIQSTIPKNKMGRVSSIYITLTSLASFLGTIHLSLFLLVIPDVELLLLITSIFGFASAIALYLVTRIIKLKSENYKIFDKKNLT